MLLGISTTLLLAAVAAAAQPRFDTQVRNDFFAGFTGDAAALERGMKKCEEILAANPKHAEAMVWHGSGVFVQSGQAARAKDYVKATELYQRGLDEMAAAVALAPANVAVIIPRGATLLTASQNMRNSPRGKELLQIGLADYERAYEIQKDYFDKVSGHGRGELLFGLAEGYERLGDHARARQWFEKLAAVNDPANGHWQQAKTYLESNKLEGPRTCVGCHVGK